MTTAIKRQNWLAVGLEFVIVVLGVVIGFQFSLNSGNRADRREEQRILAQLDAEIAGAIEQTEQFLRGRELRLELLSQTAQVIQSDENQDLTAPQCDGIRDSHVPFFDNVEVQTVDELTNSGATRVLQATGLRGLIFEYSRVHAGNREVMLFIQQSMISLPDNFPNSIRYEARSDAYGAGIPICNVEAMAASIEFQNALFGNIQRVTALRDFTRRELNALVALRESLNSLNEESE
ncbi:hypothetical protein V0U79_10770 [Hyphobacterium sp. HN65]|uniref:Uncharacterized protein n=1 Tax=Hyphobacterium lacteum TaxID=3116575 RepID=A0ABU7LTD4_9PROT|nr:hypothetical protein [Hyphobacterium sp. HN65]MEE2526854.1 hypothetical protein [Hyphobacterium sp. HN65]